jgi:protocatechuate 3,4-dioxygenase alpha subunit
MTGGLTPSQTIGPFFEPSMLRAGARRNVLVAPGMEGERIRIEGRVLDGERAPVPDAMVEIWQANGHGRYDHPSDTRDLPLDPAFIGFGRAGTDDEGRFWFETIKPGAVPGPDGGRPTSA